MKERDSSPGDHAPRGSTPGAPPGRGHGAALRPGRLGDRVRITRHDPGGLAPWVEYVWIVRWDLDAPHPQDVIPQPVVHAAAERDAGGEARLLVHGVGETRFHRTLVGSGHPIGVLP